MDSLVNILLILHIVGGGLALILGLVAMVTKKGSGVHKKCGYYFFPRMHKSGLGVPYITSFYTMRAYTSDYLFQPETRYMILVSDTTGVDFSLDTETSVEKPNSYSQVIYPNPTVDYLNILHHQKLTKAEIFGIDSKLIMTAYTDLDKIDVGYLSAGSYVIKLTDINYASTFHKFVKY